MTASTTATPTKEDAAALTDIHAITKMLAEMRERERLIARELDETIEKQPLTSNRAFEAARDEDEAVNSVQARAEALKDSLSGAAELADRVSLKLRRLESTKQRIQSTLEVVRSTRENEASLARLEEALAEENYERAASEASDVQRRGANAQESTKQAVEDLVKELRSGMEEALETGEGKAARRFSGLIAQVGGEEEASSSFSRFIQARAGAKAKGELENYTSKRKDAEKSIHGCLSSVASVFTENESFVLSSFGHAGILNCLRALILACDEGGAKILDKFEEEKQLPAMSSSTQNAASLDPLKAERAIGDILALLRLCNEFFSFVHGRIASATSASATQLSSSSQLVTEKANETKSLALTGSFSRSRSSLLSHYTVLEEYFMLKGVTKSTQIDSLDLRSMTSSLVDDAFYLLHTSTARALSTKSVQCACAQLNNASDLLGNNVKRALASRVADSPSRIIASCPHTDDLLAGEDNDDAYEDDDETNAKRYEGEAAANINNCISAEENANKLSLSLEEAATSEFNESQTELERVKACLKGIKEAASGFSALKEDALHTLAEKALNFAEGPLNSLKAMQYDISSDTYTRYESDDPWANSLVAILAGLARHLANFLAESALDLFVDSASKQACNLIERAVWRKRFTQLGGMQLDREVRAVLAGLAEMTGRPIRENFSRLMHIGFVLNLESVDEVLDFCSGESAMEWRLSAEEIRKALTLRVDFKPEAVAKLRL